MKRTVTIGVRTLVLVALVAIFALAVITTSPSSAQGADEDVAPWLLQPRASNKEGKLDEAYLLNESTGELFLIEGNRKFKVNLKEPGGKQK